MDAYIAGILQIANTIPVPSDALQSWKGASWAVAFQAALSDLSF